MIPIRSYGDRLRTSAASPHAKDHPSTADRLQPSRYVWVANDTSTGVDKAAAAR